MFKEAMLFSMLLETICEAKAKDILSCKQEQGMSMTVFEDRFIELSKYALTWYGLEAKRARLFLRRVQLRLALMVNVISHRPSDY